MSKIATLTEIHTQWSIDDLFDAQDAIDINADIQTQLNQIATAEANKKGGRK